MATDWTEGALTDAFAPASQGDAVAQQFRKAMRRMTGTVSIIATQEHSLRYGMVMTAVNAVCMEPPALLVCVKRTATIHEPLTRTGRFSVNLLDEAQHGLVAPFSSRTSHEERFSHGRWKEAGGLPVLDGAQATVLCSIDSVLSYGSHDIVVGHVEDVDCAEAVSPLLWQDGRPAAARPLHSGAAARGRGARFAFAPVDSARTREAARRLLAEYLEWIGATASSHYGLEFATAAMVESDLADPHKFFPPRGRIYLVRDGDDFVGVGCLKQLTPAIGEVQRMYIQPRARRLGAGRLLLERLLADARAIGYAAVRLESLKVLSAAHALYRSVGFREIAPYAENSMKDYQSAEKLDTYHACALFMELRL